MLAKDFGAGLLFVAFGAVAIVVARDYPVGRLARMGPGFFPAALGVLLVLLGLILVARSWSTAEERVQLGALRPVLLVLGAVVAFGLLLEPWGLAVAALALIVASSLGGRQFRVVEVGALSLALIALAGVLFVRVLGLPIKILP